MKTFAIYNLGCRVNAAESNQYAQKLINEGYTPFKKNRRDAINRVSTKNKSPDLIFINTCSVTKKANIESLGLIRHLQKQFPNTDVVVSGCANLKNLKANDHLFILNNSQKEIYLSNLNCAYTPRIKDKFSHTHRFLLKVQSGCTAFCTYCTVPYQRPYLFSLPIEDAVNTVKKAISDNYKEVIITGVNLNQYAPGFSNLIEVLLTQTDIPLLSFGSIPVNCLDQKFIDLLSTFPSRISPFLHIPLQSGSDKILMSMHRGYTKKIILEKFNLLKNLNTKNIPPLSSKRGIGGDLNFGTDIIVGFPGETETDFQETYDLCQQIGFSKIHVFRYSPRPGTAARKLFLESPKIPQKIIKQRSQQLRKLSSLASQSV